MGSSIEWTNETWNVVTGCTKVSAGCDNCYAHTLAHGRLSEVYRRRLPVLKSEALKPTEEQDPFAVRVWPERMSKPAKWKEPRMIFVNSMSDLWHVDVPGDVIAAMFEVMLSVDRHTYQILTKRPTRALRWLANNHPGELPPHIWIGTSVENQEVGYRAAQLLQINAAVRWLSCEPLLGPINLQLDANQRVDWVVVGGESGLGFRRMHPNWARYIRDQCIAAGVPFFFKQWGGRTPKAGGRVLDGRTWDEFPTVPARV